MIYPTPEKVKERAEVLENSSSELIARLSRDLEQPLYKDPLYEMHELEKKEIWAARLVIHYIILVQLWERSRY